MTTRHVISVFFVPAVILALTAEAHGQDRAVGVAIDSVDVELQNARALAVEARAAYDQKNGELLRRVGAGQVPPSHASRLQRLFLLDLLQAELKAAVAYIRVLDSRELQNRAGREQTNRAVAQIKAALKRSEGQRLQLDREVRERRGPALLVALEYSMLTGTSDPTTQEDARILGEFDQVLDEIDASLKEGEKELLALERQSAQIDREVPLLQARRALANQRVGVIQIRTILAQSATASIEPLPELPEFTPLPALIPTAPGSAPPAIDLGDPEVIRRRILREDRDELR